MRRSEFHIGLEFWMGHRRWRCTDVGSRVVVAICLDELDRVTHGEDRSKPGECRGPTVPSPLTGPPYDVPEEVLDEYDLAGCRLTDDDADR